MATKAQKVRLSIFLIVAGSTLIMFFIILVGNRLLKKIDMYYIEYMDISVTGLEPGAAVKYHGVQVGRVSSLSVKDVATVRVEIEIKRGTPIKTDTEAILTLIGITGLKFVELIGGSEEAERLAVGGTIVAGQSVFETITGSAEVMIAKLEQVLSNLNQMLSPKTTETLHNALNSINDLTTQLSTLIKDNREHLTHSTAHLDTVMRYLSSTVEKADETMQAINTFTKSEELKTTLTDINVITARLRADIDSLKIAETANDFRTLIQSSNEMIVHSDLIVMRVRDDLLRSISNLEEALDNLREATEVIRENPSVLLRGRQTSGERVE